MIVSSETELQNVVDNLVQKALDLTTEEVLQKLENFIETEVYKVHSTWGDMGFRTGEFKDSWKRSNATIVTRGIVESTIFQNVSVMQQSTNPPIHIDRDSLAQIINSGIGYNFGSFNGIARPFWDEFLSWLNGNLTNLFYKNCNKVGLPISVGISMT